MADTVSTTADMGKPDDLINIYQSIPNATKQCGDQTSRREDNHGCVTEVNNYTRALAVAIAQKTYNTHKTNVMSAFLEHLSNLDLDVVLMQWKRQDPYRCNGFQKAARTSHPLG